MCRPSVMRLSETLGTVAKRSGSAMVPLDRTLVSSYRLSIKTMSLSAAVWPQFAAQSWKVPEVYIISKVFII